MGSNETWLRQQLSAALGWDDVIMEGVMDVIVTSKSEADIQDVVENFMNNDPKAVAIISEYMARRSGSQPGSRNSSAPAPPGASSSSAGAARPASAAAGGAGAGGSGGTSYATHTGRGASLGSQPSPSKQPAQQSQHQQQQQGGTPDSWLVLDKHGQHMAGSSQQQQEPAGGAQEVAGPSNGTSFKSIDAAKATLSMYKQGGRQPRRGAGSKPQGQGGKGGDGSSSSGSGLPERKVVNCLSCGKIYDCRSVTNDIIKFLERGGVCTFCGAKVALDYKGRIAQQAAAAADSTGRQQGDHDMAFGLTEGDESAATAAAVAFKDRLVEYDRNSAKRTTVIDDQSDYFEIDANAWLTDEERAELKRRRALEEAAAAARRNRLVVTIDLLGRKVLLPADEDAGRAASAAAAGGSSSSIQLGSAEAGGDGGAAAAAAGAGGTQGQKDTSSGAAGDGQARPGPTAAEVAKALRALQHLPMTQAPGLKVPAPVFIPPKAREAAAAAAAAGGAQRVANGTSATTSSSKQTAGAANSSKAGSSQQQDPAKQQQQQQQQQVKGSTGRGGSRRKLRSRVVQDDSVFDEFGAELAYEQVAGAARGAGQQ